MNQKRKILNARNLTIMVLFQFFFAFNLSAKQIPTVTGIMKTTNYGVNPVVVSSPFATNTIQVSPLANAMDYDIQNNIYLKYDLNTDTIYPAQMTLQVEVTVNRWDALNNPMTAVTKTLTIIPNNKLNQVALEQSILKLTNGYKVAVTINAIWFNNVSVQTLPKWASVESEINIDRYFDYSSPLNTSAILSSITPQDKDCDLVDEEILIQWNPPVNPQEEYQLEWTYVTSYDASGFGNYPASAFFADFKNNSTRITTLDNSYKISLLFNKGFIAFRVRAVGRDWMNPSRYVYGPWSSPDYVNMGTLSTSERFTVTAEHEKLKNWQYATSYAEEGKKKEIANYFDGSLHNRQTVTKVNSDKNVIVGETIYDYQGRPAVNVLPVPVFYNCSIPNTEPSLKYYNKFNVNNSGAVYSKTDFDEDLSGCNAFADSMDKVNGASKYYSINNPDKNNQQAYVPDAKEYPFTQIEYTPDNTGRIRSQSGVGKEFQLGTGKETKYLYGQPNQLQVDRLFASETGDASHYKKNVVIDANGQSSVTYLNQEGKTIATAMAGIPPTEGAGPGTKVDSLIYANKNQAKFTVDLFNKDALGNSILNTIPASNDQVSFNTQLLVAYKSLYEFNYDMVVDTFADPCLKNNICFQCVYDLEILVKDECGAPLHTVNKVIGKFVPGTPIVFTTSCSTGPSAFTHTEPFNLVLNPGVYTISKTLKINKDARDFYLAKYTDTTYNKCFKSLSQFQAEAMANIDTSGCNVTCASCVTALGTKEDYVSSGQGTASQWDFLYEACVEPCRYKSLCDVTYDMMLSDVSPGGQYGKFNNITFSAISEPLSVYNQFNSLNSNQLSSNGANWHFPRLKLNGTIYTQYLDESGVRTKAPVVQISPCVFSPPVVNCALVFTDPSTSQLYTWPENLQNLGDFIPLWDPGFAKSLVMYHPEYAYYLSCSDRKVKFPGDVITSDGLDSLMEATTTFSAAVAAGLINANWNTNVPAQTKLKDIWLTPSGTVYDPFFTNNGYQYTTVTNPTTGRRTNVNMAGAPFNINLQSRMNFAVNNYRFIGSTPYTMADVAAIIARCGNNFGATPTATCLAFGMDKYSPPTNPLNDSVRNEEWRLYRHFYFSEKQKLMFVEDNFYAQHNDEPMSNFFGGCNACFGTGSYNPFTSKMIIIPPLLPYPFSAYFDGSQPCAYSTYGNYAGVTKRFYDPANTGLNTNLAAVQIYQMTGQCPMAVNLQNFLGAMASQSLLTVPLTTLNTVGQFNPDMYLAVSGGVNPPSFIPYQWQVASIVGPLYTANIVDPTTSTIKCTVKIDISGSGIPNYASILNITQLQYDPSGPGTGAFTAVAVYQTGTVVASANIKGNSSCFDLKNCNFPPECTANQFASDMQTLLSYLATNSQLNSATPIALWTSTTSSIYLTSTIKNTLGTPNANINYKFVAPNKLMLFNAGNTNTIVLTITSVVPAGTLPSTFYFGNMKSNYNHLFKMEGYNTSNVKVNDIDGKAELVSPTSTTGISMGDCALPTTVDCSQKEHKVREDLEKLTKEILTTKPLNTNVDLYSLVNFTPLLKSYLPGFLTSTFGNYISSVAPNPNYDTLNINLSNAAIEGGCTFKLFHHRNNGTVLNFTNITDITDLTGIGTPDIAGNYTYFYAIATYTYGSNTYQDTIYGKSCWPIKNCNPCPPVETSTVISQSKRDSINVSNGIAFFDPALPAYTEYKTAIDSLNIKQGWLGTTSAIAPVSYFDFAEKGLMYAKQYVKFVNNFDSVVDSKNLLKVDSFLIKVGNAPNCNHEYKRYSKSVQVYNNKTVASNNPSFTLTAIPDSTYYTNHLCDSTFAYVKYLKQFQVGSGIPVSITQFFNIPPSTSNATTTPTNPGDSCKILYDIYVNVHSQFVSNPVVLQNCQNANINHPLYSLSQIQANNLCCSNQGLFVFQQYINSLANASVSCPPPLPKLEQCQPPVTGTDLFICERNYFFMVSLINAYNASPYAAINNYTLNPNIYPNFYSFYLAGYCDCVVNYINYLQMYINWAPGTVPPPLPKTIDEWPGCPHSVQQVDSCRLKYEKYITTVNAYNNFIKNNPGLGYPPISAIIKFDEFIKLYCKCVDKFIAGLQSIIQGFQPSPKQLATMLDLPSNCEKPCSNPMDSTFVFPPYTKYDNPCVTQAINLAMQNAANAYQQYLDSVTTAFIAAYTKHCLGAVENFIYKYVDKEYHFTLYYYDQAGNLVRTIPPEGIEPIPVTSFTDPLEQKIISDRTFKQQNVFTAHRLPTKYIYNSLNQLIYQSLPDHNNMDICDGTNPNGIDTSVVINSIQFVTPNKGYLCGYILNSVNKRGVVYTSNDGGNFWTKVNGVTSGDLQKVQFVSTTVGYAVSNFGMVFKTVDGGNNWDLLTTLYNPTSGNRYVGQLYDLYFKNANDGVVGGISSSGSTGIYYTTNGGASFSEASVTGLVVGDTLTGFGYDGTTVIATSKRGIEGRLYKSTNNSNWSLITNYSANTIRKVQFINNNLAFAVGDEGTLLKSTQLISPGSPPKWQLVPTNVLGTIRDVYFKNATDGVALIDTSTGKSKIWKTFNGGITWQNLSAPGDYYTSLELYDIGQHRLLATGQNGLVAKILLNTPPFGIIKLNTPTPTTNYSYGDAILQPSGALLTMVVNAANGIIHSTYDSQPGAPTWFTVNTTTMSPPISGADASFVKVLVSETNNTTPDIQALLLTTTGKIYSYYRAFNAPTAVCNPVTMTGGFSGKFFNDITTGDAVTASTFFAYDSIAKTLHRITFSGSTASSFIMGNVPAITRKVNSIEVINSAGNEILAGGVNGHILYGKLLNTPNAHWANTSLNVTPTRLNKPAASFSGANNFIAVGLDGTVWKNAPGNINDWYLKNSGTIENLNAVDVAITGVGLIAGNNGKLFQVTNANSQTPVLTPVTSLISADLTDVALDPSGGTSAYVTGANGKVQYVSNYNTPNSPPPALASSPASSAVNGVAYKASAAAAVVGNNVYVANYFATSAIVTKNLHTRGLNSIHFFDVNNGFVIDSADVIRRTTDGGSTWSVVVPDVGSPALTKIFAKKSNQAVLVGLSAYARVINNNAMSVIPAVGIPTNTHFYDVNFNNNNYGVIVGSTVRAAKIVPVGATNFAITYIGQASTGPKLPSFFTVHVFDNNTFLAAGGRGFIYYGKAGLFYQQINYIPNSGSVMNQINFRDSYFHDYYTGYVVGDRGHAYKVILNDTIGAVGMTPNSIAWQTFCSNALYMNYTSPTQIADLNFNAIAFANRTNGMVGGSDNNIVIGGISPNKYSRLLKDESGYYSTRFWYDKLGRLILSQNTKQFNKTNPSDATVKQAFSYTRYDALGRIVEVGEKYENHGVGAVKFKSIFGSLVSSYYNLNAIDDAKLTTWINGAGSRREVTKTYYDVQSILPITFTQENLRKRVATTTFEDIFDGNDFTYQHGTHYTYDIHGNVNTIWQENTQVGVPGQNFKQIDYQFDLISGKVNKVIYSPGKPDQFIHKYSYDADNRITKVETGKDGVSYDIDAKYFYYDHGPLARIEYGKDHVQGMDYAYTLQGWMKGANSNAVKKSKDMGSDGDLSFVNPNGNFARDIVGFSLNYYQGDYNAIDLTKWNNPDSRWEAYHLNSDIMNSRNDLFNGNITAMMTTICKPDTTPLGIVLDPVAFPAGNAYRYDQLNRIKRSSSFTNVDTNSVANVGFANANRWQTNGSSIAGLYRNVFTYDANGNIETQVKRDSLGNVLDSLTYRYEESVPGKKVRNRLYHVNDATNTPLIPGDIEDQGIFSTLNINTANNYSFDEIGNLIKDNAEDIAQINWMVTGKIKSVIRPVGSPKDNLIFDYDAAGNRVAKHVYTSANVWKKSTYYVRDAQGNVMSVYDKKGTGSMMSYKLGEQHLYGAARIGMVNPDEEMIGAVVNTDSNKVYLGKKSYELSNHLGNVLAVITDKKLSIDDNGDNVLDHYVANIVTSSDYYPFGSVMPGRQFNSESYRYGFNGQEKDDEVRGTDNSYAFEYRISDPRLGRFLTIDPLQGKFPYYSTYQFAACNPILAEDLEGLESADDKNTTTIEAPKVEVTNATTPNIDLSLDARTNNTSLAPKWSISVGNNLSTPAQQQSGLSHPTLIYSTNQSFYNTNITSPFAIKGNDLTESDHFIQVLRGVDGTNMQIGLTMFKEKTNYNSAGFGYEAPSPTQITFSKHYELFASKKGNFKMDLNLQAGGGTVLGIPRVQGIGNLNKFYKPVGTSFSMIAKVDFVIAQRFVFFVAVTSTHVDMKDQNTPIGYQSGASYDSIGLKGGFGININGRK